MWATWNIHLRISGGQTPGLSPLYLCLSSSIYSCKAVCQSASQDAHCFVFTAGEIPAKLGQRRPQGQLAEEFLK